jgi:hypothetical protein
MLSFQMFVLDVLAYLLLKSGQIKTKPAFARKFALKDALAKMFHPGQTTLTFQNCRFPKAIWY